MKTIKFSNILLVNADGRILVLRRTIEHPSRPLTLDLPGGGLEDGESFEQAAVRELWEETGLHISFDDLQVIRIERQDSPERSIEGAVYKVDMPAKNIGVLLSNEHDQYHWVKAGDLLNLHIFHQESLRYAIENNFIQP